MATEDPANRKMTTERNDYESDNEFIHTAEPEVSGGKWKCTRPGAKLRTKSYQGFMAASLKIRSFLFFDWKNCGQHSFLAKGGGGQSRA